MKTYKLLLLFLTLTFLLTGCIKKENLEKTDEHKSNIKTEKTEEHLTLDNNEEDKPKAMSKKLTEEELLINANILTEQLITYVILPEYLVGTEDLSDLDLYRLFISTQFYKDNPLYLYNDYSKLSDDEMYIFFTLNDVQTIIEEISGKNQWLVNFDSSYDEHTKTYVIPTSIGPSGYFSADLIEEKIIDNDTIEIKCSIKDRLGESIESHGIYKVLFEIVRTENKDFLRFEKLEKIN